MAPALRSTGIVMDNDYANYTKAGGLSLSGHFHRHILTRTDGMMLGMNGLIAENARLKECLDQALARLAAPDL